VPLRRERSGKRKKGSGVANVLTGGHRLRKRGSNIFQPWSEKKEQRAKRWGAFPAKTKRGAKFSFGMGQGRVRRRSNIKGGSNRLKTSSYDKNARLGGKDRFFY